MPRRPARDVIAVRVLPAPRIAVGGAEEHQHLFALADPMPADLDLARRGPEEGLHRALEPDRLLERVTRQRRIGAQPRQLVGKPRQAIDRGAKAVDGGIDPGRKQRAHQQRRLRRGDVAAVDAGVDAGPEAPGREVVALALFGDIGLMRRRALDGVLTQLVRRPEGIEHQARIGQQILAPLLLQAHRIGKHRHRIGFGQVGDGVEALPFQQFFDLGGGGRGKAIAELLHDRRRQHLAQHRAGPRVLRRIGLENDALRTPRFFPGKIAQSDAAAGAEGGGIVEDGVNLGVAGNAVDRPFVEMDQRPRVAHPRMVRIGIVEKFDRERIDVETRNGRVRRGADA